MLPEDDDIEDSITDYVIWDIRHYLASPHFQKWVELETDEQVRLVHAVMSDYYPDHDGLSVQWDMQRLARLLEHELEPV